MEGQIMLQNGMDVYGADGEKLGTIHEVRDNYFVIEKGFFFPKDYYIPLSAAEGVDPDNRVYLNVTKDVALNQDWDVQPQDQYATGNANLATGGTYESVSNSQSEVIDSNFVAATDTPASGSEATRVPVYEEEITPIKRSVDRGAVAHREGTRDRRADDYRAGD